MWTGNSLNLLANLIVLLTDNATYVYRFVKIYPMVLHIRMNLLNILWYASNIEAQ